MVEIKDLLKRYEKLLFSEEAKREAVCAAVAKATGIKIKPEQVKIKGNTAYLSISPLYKNEIMLKRDKIEEGLTLL